MELSPKQKGNLTELQCLTSFIKYGCTVSIPYGDNARYDFIIDTGKQLLRIQVKTSCWLDNEEKAFSFNGYSQHSTGNGNKRMKYTNKEIDYFMTEKNNIFYLYPATEQGFTQKILRLSTNGQSNNPQIFWAKDYEFEEVSKKF